MSDGKTLAGHAWHRLQLAVLRPLETLGDLVEPVPDEALGEYTIEVAQAIRRYARAGQATSNSGDDTDG